jgi:hypothetical protein
MIRIGTLRQNKLKVYGPVKIVGEEFKDLRSPYMYRYALNILLCCSFYRIRLLRDSVLYRNSYL